jgi:hypothetical protein
MEAPADVAASATNDKVAHAGSAATSTTRSNNVAAPGKPGKPDLDAELRAVWDKNHPLRGPDGRFLSRDAAADGQAAPGNDIDIKNESDQSAEVASAREGSDRAGDGTTAADNATPPVEQPNPAIDPPPSWSAEMKAKWSELPADVQTYVAQRDKETEAAIMQAGQQAKAYEPIEKLIAANQELFARRNVTPAQGLAVLVAAQRSLDADPKAGLAEIARAYGIDLGPALPARDASPARQTPAGQAPAAPQAGEEPKPDEAPPDPARLVAALRDEVRQITQRVAAHESRVKAQEQEALQARNAARERAIAAFAADKPYFQEVRPLIDVLLQSGQAKELTGAYDMAVNAHPDIRQRIQADQRKAEDEKRAAEARAKADQARRAAAVNVRSTPGGAPANPRTVDETLNEIARRRYAP